MSGARPSSYTSAHELRDDGSMAFACSTDEKRWAWLRLHPFDPIVAQSLNFYGAYEVAVARGRYERGQWTALTEAEWRCGESGAGHAVRGIAHAPDPEAEAWFRLTFYDGDDALVYEMSGTGVVFRDRDFSAWRQEQKDAVLSTVPEELVPVVAPERVGVATPIESFVSPLEEREGVLSARALVTRESGFPPVHPYHDGSGDHANAAHLADICRQFLSLAKGDPYPLFGAGTMHFRAYVELDRPMWLTLEGEAVVIRQGERECARVLLEPAQVTDI